MSLRILYELIILLGIIPLIVFPESILGPFKNEYIVKQHILFFYGLIMLFSFVRFCVGSSSFKIKNTDKLILLFFIFSVISWMIARQHSNADALLMLSGLAIVYLRFSHIAHSDRAVSKIPLIWVTTLSVVGIIGFMQWGTHEQVTATLGNRNFFAGFILSGLPFLFWYGYESFQHRRLSALKIIILSGLMLLLLFNLYHTRSRAAWLLLGVLLPVNFGIVLGRYRRVYIIIVILCLAGALLHSGVRSRISKEIKDDVRPYIWQGTLEMISEHPLFGCGVGSFFIAYPAYRPHDYFLTPKSTDTTRHAHNEWLEIWAETGSFAFFSLVALFFLLVYRIYRYHQRQGISGLMWALICSCTLIGLHNMVDVNMRFTTTAVLFWVQIGLISAYVECGQPVTIPQYVKRFSVAAYALLIVSTLFLVYFFLIQQIRSEILFQKGIDARDRKDWNTAVEFYQCAAAIDTDNLSLLYHLAFAYNKIGQTTEAIDTYQNIIEHAPYYASVRKNLGTLFLKEGLYEQAVREYQIQTFVNPYDPDIFLNMAYCYNKLLMDEEAQTARQQAIAIYLMQAKRFFADRNWKEARQYLENILDIDPQNLDAMMYLTAVYYHGVNQETGLTMYRDILGFYPDRADLKKRMDQLLNL